jgi:hypothetical protein
MKKAVVALSPRLAVILHRVRLRAPSLNGRGLVKCIVDQKVTGSLSFIYCFGQPPRMHPSPGPGFAMRSSIFRSNHSTGRSSPFPLAVNRATVGYLVKFLPQGFCSAIEDLSDLIAQFA